jgi:hypothetical protein
MPLGAKKKVLSTKYPISFLLKKNYIPFSTDRVKGGNGSDVGQIGPFPHSFSYSKMNANICLKQMLLEY